MVTIGREQDQGSNKQWKQKASHNRKPTGQGNRVIMNFAGAGVVDQAGAEAPFAPERQDGEGCQASAGGCEKVGVEREIHAL